MKRLFCLLTLVALFAVAPALAEDVMTLPADLSHIEAEAFAGDASIGKAVLPDGLVSIGSRAFADSGLTEINLPASLTYIADDAFEGCTSSFFVNAKEGTYAYRWAVNHNYIKDVPLQKIVVGVVNRKKISVFENFQIPFHTEPINADVNLVWKSSDTSMATIDQNGVVTPHQPGLAYFYLTDTVSHIQETVILQIIGTKEPTDGLMYELMPDQNGYRIVGCDGNPEHILIPATYEGLPVKAYQPGAFKNCNQLMSISLAEDHTELYIENHALYADLPEKTLLCFPCAYQKQGNYRIAEGTEAVAPYAFSQSWLRTLYVPEGVLRIGERAFYNLLWYVSIYWPDSTTEFGIELFQNQQFSAAFYVNSKESPAAAYADKYQIPWAPIGGTTEPTASPTPMPQTTPEPNVPSVDESRVVVFKELDQTFFDTFRNECLYDLSAYEGDDVSEVRMEIGAQWAELVYFPELSQQTGLYGAGYTEQDAVLRAYDADGQQIGAKKISGNFTFCFDGARTLGVSDGKGTRMTVLPTKPIYVYEPGTFTVSPENWHKDLEGNYYYHYIVAMPHSMVDVNRAIYITKAGLIALYCTNGEYVVEDDYSQSAYTFCGVEAFCPADVNYLSDISISIDQMLCLLRNDDFICYVMASQPRSDHLGELIYQVFQATRKEMLNGHYPSDQAISQVEVHMDGSYPGVVNNIVDLDEAYFVYDDSDFQGLSHEFVHAIDHNLFDSDFLIHPWLEGRAEYISKQLCEALGMPYTSNYGEGTAHDWSFVSETDRADFYRYYCESTNRYTQYDVGYYFYVFLIDTYGDSVGASIMRNVAESGINLENCKEVFLQCVESATEPGVFQRFVEEVIVPSGT